LQISLQALNELHVCEKVLLTDMLYSIIKDQQTQNTRF